jgi:putative sigma-54 modulation protein
MAKFVGNFTESMKDYTEKKLMKLANRGVDYENARVTYEKIAKNNCIVEISIGNKIRAKKKGLAEDFYDIVLEVISCITSQVDRYKKYVSNKRSVDLEEFMTVMDDIDSEDEVAKYTISKNKTLFVEGMHVEDAIEEMEVLGHSFFIFKDLDNGEAMTVLYARYDGTYGTIKVVD